MAILQLDGSLYAAMIMGGAACLHSRAEDVNQLNVFPVPDGDTGYNMFMTIDGGASAVSQAAETDSSLEKISNKVADGMLHGARGNSGVILSQFFAGIAKGFEGCEAADLKTICSAMECGVKRAYEAVVSPIEGTILTVARESVDYAVSKITALSTIESFFKDLQAEMKRSLQRTPELLEILREAGVIDSGGAGLFYIMEGFNKVLDGSVPSDIDPEFTSTVKSAENSVDFSLFTEDSELKYGYCTELLIRLQKQKCDIDGLDVSRITDFLSDIGDSIVCFRDGSLLKLHVHTMTPEKVLDFCHGFGEFLSVKIENMTLQHSESANKNKTGKRRRYGAVAVASGEGIGKLFGEMGADAVVRGGQTANPSAHDFLEAFGAVNADVIFVFPNNGNIILAAKQAAEIYKDSKVYVVESKTPGEGYAALTSLNYEPDDPEVIVSELNEAISRVVTGMLSTATRDACISSVDIHKGEYLGIIGKNVIVSDPDRSTAAKELLSRLSLEDKYALTVFVGVGAAPDECSELENYIRDKYPDIETYIVNGGQEVYDYIMVAE